MKKILILAVAFLIAYPSLFAQGKAGKQDAALHTVLNTCPVSSVIIQYEPGKCPFCGMNLNVSPKELMKLQVTNAYSCPMNADMASNIPGRKVNVSLKEQMKMGVVKLNSVPQHVDGMNIAVR